MKWFVSLSRGGVVVFPIAKPFPDQGEGSWCFVDGEDYETALEQGKKRLKIPAPAVKAALEPVRRGRVEGHQPDCGCPACRANS